SVGALSRRATGIVPPGDRTASAVRRHPRPPRRRPGGNGDAASAPRQRAGGTDGNGATDDARRDPDPAPAAGRAPPGAARAAAKMRDRLARGLEQPLPDAAAQPRARPALAPAAAYDSGQ